jgi:two-component system sensor histidine kinase TctE
MRKALERLRLHSETAGHLATQLLSLARAEPGGPPASGQEILDLTAVAREACAALVPGALSRGVDLGFDGNDALLVRGHDLLLREMISNLVDNALRYGRERGRVTVGVGSVQGGGPTLYVEDDGPGIPPWERVRVLERFYRLPGTPGTGAGLGLAIVRELAHRHGGTVHLLDGAGGSGLRVEIRFPTFEVGEITNVKGS